MKKLTVLAVATALAFATLPAAAMAAPVDESVIAPEVLVGSFNGTLAPGVTANTVYWSVDNAAHSVYLDFTSGKGYSSWYLLNTRTGLKYYPYSTYQANIPAGAYGQYRVVLTNNTSVNHLYDFDINMY